MKKILLSIFACLLFFSSHAQLSKTSADAIPDEVKAGLKAKFKSAKPTAYFTDQDENYVITVPVSGKPWNAKFAANGTWIESQTPLDIKTIPGVISNKMKASEYKAWKIKKAYEFQDPKNKKLFKLEIVNKKETNTLYYDAKGLLIKDENVDGGDGEE